KTNFRAPVKLGPLLMSYARYSMRIDGFTEQPSQETEIAAEPPTTVNCYSGTKAALQAYQPIYLRARGISDVHEIDVALSKESLVIVLRPIQLHRHEGPPHCRLTGPPLYRLGE